MRNIVETTAATAFTPGVASLTDTMDQMGVRMTFARDEEIFAQGEEADLIYRLVSGSVRTTRLMHDGRRQIGEFHYMGEIFGIEANDEHRFSGEALTDCVVTVLRRSAFVALVRSHPDLERQFWSATAKALQRSQDHLLLIGRKTACEKVASFLIDMAERQKAELVSLPMGRQDMADYLGLTIETVSRMLTQLQSSRMVEFTDSRHFRIPSRQSLARFCQ